MTERPDRRRGLWIGYALLSGFGLIAITGSVLTLTRPPSPWIALASTAAALALIGAIGVTYILRGLQSARYYLDRNGLTVTWWPAVHVIPIHTIQELRHGPTTPRAIRSWRGLRWPGLYVGHAWAVEENRPVLFFATEDLPRQLWVITEVVIYAISPVNPEKFMEAAAQRMALGPTQRLQQTTIFPKWRQRAIWEDRNAWALIALAGLVLWGMWLWICVQLPRLPSAVRLEGSSGALFSPAIHLTRLPLLGALTWIIHAGLGSLLHEQERVAAYGLWLVGLLVQILLFGALIQIVR
ncbi:PH domain-containing protein [Thermoflexus sp.]|uniref:PH domain-containing protein n=1 Tax=Thermoflexus sp. TaxID=1969742 RepID=UPI0035E444CE